MKPARFVAWLFAELGARPGHELVDIYPRSGAISRAWAHTPGQASRRNPNSVGNKGLNGARRGGRARGRIDVAPVAPMPAGQVERIPALQRTAGNAAVGERPAVEPERGLQVSVGGARGERRPGRSSGTGRARARRSDTHGEKGRALLDGRSVGTIWGSRDVLKVSLAVWRWAGQRRVSSRPIGRTARHRSATAFAGVTGVGAPEPAGGAACGGCWPRRVGRRARPALATRRATCIAERARASRRERRPVALSASSRSSGKRRERSRRDCERSLRTHGRRGARGQFSAHGRARDRDHH